MKFPRIYHPYESWEESRFNMWGVIDDRNDALERAIEFTGDWKLYGSYMRRVTNEWPVSCENALTDQFINQKAWLGHAAVAMALQIPEDITRLAWGKLSDEQQLLANEEAGRAIATWKDSHAKDRGLYPVMGVALLSQGDTGRCAAAPC